MTAGNKKPAGAGGRAEIGDDYTVNLYKNIEYVKRGIDTLTRVYAALPDVMRSADLNFLTRFARRELTEHDKEIIGQVRREADSVEKVCIDDATARHVKGGADLTTARRLAAAEFAALFACAVDFGVRGLRHE